MSTLDFNAPPPNHKVSVSVEREETAGEQRVRLFKDVVLFLVAIGFVVVVVSLCLETLRSQASADEKKWAMSVISAATGGIIGYLVRK